MKKKICAFLLTAALLTSPVFGSASAARIETVPTGAHRDIGVVAADYPEVGTTLEPDVELPSSFSNRELSMPVRQQTSNACWAFSAASIMEIAANKAGIYSDYFSPLHMNCWGTTQSNGKGWQRGVTSGGYPYIAMGYLTSYSGVVKEADFPITGTLDDYNEWGSSLTPFIGADSVIFLNGNDRDTIKTAIYQYGAAVGNYHTDMSYYNTGQTAYYCDFPGLSVSQLNGHAITVLGWDDNYSRENFNEAHRPESDGAWYCKNSWGPGGSADGGYFWISYEDYYLFDSRFGPSYAVVSLEQHDSDVHLYQNEIYGVTTEFDYMNTKQALTCVNVFDFKNGYNELDKIMFETLATGADYTISYIPLDENDTPLKDQDQWVTLGTGTVDYQGYVCIDIDNYTVPSKKAGIGVTITANEACSKPSIGVGETLTVGSGFSQRNVFEPDAKIGGSWVLYDKNNMLELNDLYQRWWPGEGVEGNLVIKAFANIVDIMGDVDLDKQVTILDVTKIQRRLADLEAFDELQEKLADYDADELVTILDCTKIQRVLADIEECPYIVG